MQDHTRWGVFGISYRTIPCDEVVRISSHSGPGNVEHAMMTSSPHFDFSCNLHPSVRRPDMDATSADDSCSWSKGSFANLHATVLAELIADDTSLSPLQLSNPAPQIANPVADPHANLKPAGLDCSTQVCKEVMLDTSPV